MTHLFEKRDFWGNRFSLWVVVLMAFVAPLGWWSARQIRVENDFGSWLPANDTELRALQWTRDLFPMEERVLLTWDGSSINDPRVEKLVEELAGKPDSNGLKRGGLPYVSSVIDPRQALDVMQKNGIAPHDAVRRLEGTIIGAGPLRLRMTESGRAAMRKTKRELQTAMQAKFGVDLAMLDASPDLAPLISIPSSVDENGAIADPSPPAILSVDGSLSGNLSVEHDLQVAWKGMRIGSESTIAVAKWLTEYIPERGDGVPLVEGCFFAPGSPVALAVGISDAGLAEKSETVAAIRSACKRAGIPAEALHMAGSTITANELNQEVMKAAWDPSFPFIQIHHRSALLASALVSAVLALALLRNLRLATMVIIVALFTTFGTLALIPATESSMSVVMVALPTLLLVVTMAGGMHVVHHWQAAARVDESTAISQTVQSSWTPSLMASLAMAIGVLALGTSKLASVREFGLYAAAGVMLSLLMVTLALPSLMQLWSGRPTRTEATEQSGWRMFGKLLTAHAGWQSLAMLTVCAACCAGLSRFHAETKILPDNARLAQDYWYLETSLAGVMPVESIIRFDQQAQKDTNFLERMELIRQIQEKMRVHPEVSGSSSLADYQPVNERPAEESSFLQRTKYNKRAAQIQQQIREGGIPAARSHYTIAEKGFDLNETGDGKLNQAGDELWRITAQVNQMTDHDLSVVVADLNRITQDVLKLQPGSQHLIIGAVPLFVKTQRAMWDGFISSLAVAIGGILVLQMISLRSIGGGLLAMIPNVVPVAMTFGVLSWLDQRIDIGSMLTASIAIGIAAMGSLHFMINFQRAMQRGKMRSEAICETLDHCGPAISQASTILAGGFLVLISAELLLLSRFGGLMAAMTGVSLVGNLVLLPQLLGGPLGRLFDLPQAQLVEPALVEVAPHIEPAPLPLAPLPVESIAPPPHIKPHNPGNKKRRSSSRKEPDAG